MASEQAKQEIKDVPKRSDIIRNVRSNYSRPMMGSASRTTMVRTRAEGEVRPAAAPALTKEQHDKFKQMLEDLVGTRGAYILDSKLSILGKVPNTELSATIRSLNSGIFAVVFDGTATDEITGLAERAGVSYVISMDSTANAHTKVKVLTKPAL